MEMLIAIAIIGLVTATVLSGEQTFQRTVLTSNTAYDVAITIRNTEEYAIGSLRTSAGFTTPTGIDFLSSAPSNMQVFADIYPAANSGSAYLCFTQPNGTSAPNSRPGDCMYTKVFGTYRDTSLPLYTIGNNVKITNVCGKKGATTYCWSGGTPASQFDVVFARPATNAYITASSAGSLPPIATNLDSLCITLKGANGSVARYVYVTAIGQVSARNTICP